MSLDFLSNYYIPLVVAACLIVGYCVKKINFIPNKFIPSILAVMGAILGCVASHDVSLELIVMGAFSGLSSTGLHQLFKQLIEGEDDEDPDDPDDID